VNWRDHGLIIPPVEDDPASPLHPAQQVDRPHIIWNARTRRFVCWIKVMGAHPVQRSTVLVAESLLGPYRIVREWLRPLGMNAGDFDLVVDPTDSKAYYYFERVHSELICADLTDDYTGVTGYYSTHFPNRQPPFVREAPAYFRRRGQHYLITSGTTGYHPNPSEVATAPTYHGPWTVLGDLHPSDLTRTSFHSQISHVLRHPAKQDLYIALADRWMSGYTGDSAAALSAYEAAFAEHPSTTLSSLPDADVDTSLATYVWLPIRFDEGAVRIDWLEEWRIDDYD
jgi:hypothetical protein